jgi:small subunit ribosomal protein S8
MSVNFQLADMVSRINVASSRKLGSVRVNYTTLNMRVLMVLYRNGVIRGFQAANGYIVVLLKYVAMRPVFRQIKVISRPGCRIYWKLSRLSLVYNYNNFSGFFIISSPRGLVTSNDCLLGMRTSGEVLLQVSI